MNLRAVPSDTLPGGVNMAVDYHLAAGFEPGEGPICRFYRWSGPTVTAGRTVPEDAALSAARAHPGASLFRRPTGGGVVFHADQLSFSVIWPRTLPALRDLRQSYMSLHLVLKEALAGCGVPVVQAAGPAPGRRRHHSSPPPPGCGGAGGRDAGGFGGGHERSSAGPASTHLPPSSFRLGPMLWRVKVRPLHL